MNRTLFALLSIAPTLSGAWAGACAGAPAASADIEAGASPGAGFGGGATVVPSFGADGSSGGAGTGYVYGSGSGDGASPCPRDAAADAAADAASGVETGPGEAGADAYACAAPLAPGDLLIDELMIASQSGTGDHGEWLEVMSTRDCALNVKGLYAEAPHGKGTTLATVASDTWIGPHGFFVIADSAESTQNHDLPGTVVTWGSGTSSDVLRNSGDTITLYTASAVIDTLTYPSTSRLVDGASMSFPASCDPALRSVFGNWQPSIASWTPGFFGTPSAPNTDVACPVAPPPPPGSGGVPPCGG